MRRSGFVTLASLLLIGAGIVGGGPAGAGASAVAVNFDDGSRPCNFASAVALGGWYRSTGVRFSGPGDSNGGAVLDQCGGFGVTGYSAPNFLAFNSLGTPLSDGGIPKAPETIQFHSVVSHVEMLVGSGSGAGKTLRLRAYDASQTQLDEAVVTLSSQMQLVSLDAAGISIVRVTGSASIFVLDDLVAT